MVQKKILVDNVRLSYNGPFDIIEFYKTVEDWIRDNGMEKEIKKKLEYVTPKGKQLEWSIECWKNPNDFVKHVVRLRALFNNVKEVEIENNGKKVQLNQADVLLIFDGIMEADISTHWTQKPLFYFLRALFDKYIYKHFTERFEAPVPGLVNSLKKTLKNFFDSYSQYV